MTGHALLRWREAALQTPASAKVGRRAARSGQQAISTAVLLLFDADDFVIARIRPERPVIWPARLWEWIERVESAVPDIREEIEAFRRDATIPSTYALVGGGGDDQNVPVAQGEWLSLSLRTPRGWVDGAAERFPATVRAFDGVPALGNLGFSLVTPGSHIASHRDPNGGALRLQVPIAVPGPLGACRMRVVDEVVQWQEGQAVVFDLAAEHEVWNDADEDRVLLMAELSMPLPPPASWLNRVTQMSYRYHPSFRGMEARAAPALAATAS